MYDSLAVVCAPTHAAAVQEPTTAHPRRRERRLAALARHVQREAPPATHTARVHDRTNVAAPSVVIGCGADVTAPSGHAVDGAHCAVTALAVYVHDRRGGTAAGTTVTTTISKRLQLQYIAVSAVPAGSASAGAVGAAHAVAGKGGAVRWRRARTRTRVAVPLLLWRRQSRRAARCGIHNTPLQWPSRDAALHCAQLHALSTAGFKRRGRLQ